MSSDPTTWGVQPNGWVTPTLQEILEDLSRDLRAEVDPEIDLDPDAPEGQQVAIYSRQVALLWEQGRILHDSNNPDNAEGDLLADIAKLSGTALEGPRATTVLASCALAAGTTLEPLAAFAAVNDHPDLLFTPILSFTAPSDGTYSILFECTQTGPITVNVHTLQVISSPVVGWTSVDNSVSGVTGSAGDTDDDLRLRRGSDLAKTGTSTALALEGDISAVTGVISVTVLENLTDTTDGNGVLPHRFLPVIYASGELDTAALARAIWYGRPGGIRWQGTTDVSFTDDSGILRTVSYTPVETKPVYLSFTLTKGSDYVGDAAFKSSLVSALASSRQPGDDVVALKVVAEAFKLSGVEDVTSYALGFTTSPTAQANLTISATQIATFDVARITVT